MDDEMLLAELHARAAGVTAQIRSETGHTPSMKRLADDLSSALVDAGLAAHVARARVRIAALRDARDMIGDVSAEARDILRGMIEESDRGLARMLAPPDAHPREVPAVVEARPGSLAASDDEREPEGGPAGDEVG